MVTVVDRGKIHGTKMIKNFKWSTQGYEYSSDIVLFPLVGCDLILGMKWLRTLGAITSDCANLTMEFMRNKKKIKLVANQEVRHQFQLGDKDQPQLKE